jgi:hypothetical protein
MVFNTTFNNISVITWRSVLLVEEIGIPLFQYPRELEQGERFEKEVGLPILGTPPLPLGVRSRRKVGKRD